MRGLWVAALSLVALTGCTNVQHSPGSPVYSINCGASTGWGVCEKRAASICPGYSEITRQGSLDHKTLNIRCNGPAVALAGEYDPLVDMKGKDPAQWQTDRAECLAYAPASDAGDDALMGAVIGSVIGAGLGAAVTAPIGYPGIGAASGGASGGIVGGLTAASQSGSDGVMIVRRCLAGRGYNVLR